MRFKKIEGFITDTELEDISKQKEMFVGIESSSRAAMQSADAAVSGDIAGLCGYIMAMGHTLREYAILADVSLTQSTEQNKKE